MPRKAVKLPRVSETVLASPAAPALHTPAASATLERGRFLSESDDRGDHHAQHLRSRQRGLPLGAGAALRRVRRKVRFGLKLLFLIPALLCAFWVSGDARQRPLRRDSRPKLNLIACIPSHPNRAGLSPGRTAPGAAQAPPRFVPSRTLSLFAICTVWRVPFQRLPPQHPPPSLPMASHLLGLALDAPWIPCESATGDANEPARLTQSRRVPREAPLPTAPRSSAPRWLKNNILRLLPHARRRTMWRPRRWTATFRWTAPCP